VETLLDSTKFVVGCKSVQILLAQYTDMKSARKGYNFWRSFMDTHAGDKRQVCLYTAQYWRSTMPKANKLADIVTGQTRDKNLEIRRESERILKEINGLYQIKCDVSFIDGRSLDAARRAMETFVASL
jgi:hypothetical protein